MGEGVAAIDEKRCVCQTGRYLQYVTNHCFTHNLYLQQLLLDKLLHYYRGCCLLVEYAEAGEEYFSVQSRHG